MEQCSAIFELRAPRAARPLGSQAVRTWLLAVLATLALMLAPNAFAQAAYNFGSWTAGPLTSQPRLVWNGGTSYTSRSPTILNASWSNGYHTATITTTQPDGFAMILNPDTVWGGSDNGPQPANGVYSQSTALGGLNPNVVIQSIVVQGGITADMVLGFYSVIPSNIRLVAYDAANNPVPLTGVNSAFQNLTDHPANNTLTLNPDGTFSGLVTPIPGGTSDSGFAGFQGFNPAIVRIDVHSTRTAPNGGVGSWGDGFSVFLGSKIPPPQVAIPTLNPWGLLMLSGLFIGLVAWSGRRRWFS